MTPEKETELFVTLAGISKMLEGVVITQENHSRQIEDVRNQVAGVRDRVADVQGQVVDVRSQVVNVQEQVAELRLHHGEALAEIRGQLSIMLQWLQSMDQRFGSLMVPMMQPKKAS
ncbi:hypothetical protein WCLP8_5400011 [uncultured Gammaproteobacteria bacterium]